ncbi:cytochrome c, 1 heme-binding site [Citrifermentans bemidjiense Bem]|uniref:Cytochrome c, 1 heme-binding site n=1 Tax=Citrifermentans bemidjiense (strain ATCC BAA-1014 / DSM 16622 / JCM 12645 / Bem) TaxID=404380 RepID=E1P6A4_CITBB|nr:cytochrome c, 1 heme-binding site [Citrifermentans bemidjiense Bem]
MKSYIMVMFVLMQTKIRMREQIIKWNGRGQVVRLRRPVCRPDEHMRPIQGSSCLFQTGKCRTCHMGGKIDVNRVNFYRFVGDYLWKHLNPGCFTVFYY